MVKLLTVIWLGAIELWVAIPVGLTLQLHPFLVCVATAVGAISGAAVVVMVGERIQNWLLRRYKYKRQGEESGFIYKVWHRYGVIGLGLFAPLLTGALIGAAIGMTLRVPPNRLLFWISVGIILWSVGLTLISVLGLTSIISIMQIE